MNFERFKLASFFMFLFSLLTFFSVFVVLLNGFVNITTPTGRRAKIGFKLGLDWVWIGFAFFVFLGAKIIISSFLFRS